jgi:hypothetical protein
MQTLASNYDEARCIFDKSWPLTASLDNGMQTRWLS